MQFCGPNLESLFMVFTMMLYKERITTLSCLLLVADKYFNSVNDRSSTNFSHFIDPAKDNWRVKFL